ncbi:TFIIB-type zinc ribbon-containing protein [Haloferax sp. ATB1]|uniref:TFIIB-type zinc ribbon-containing protein n=1 Tax=Haloferax sp. ATB1 TaxID=1508454 RepID=UPI0005B1F027|nr:TFIIB-type zinc ribbon-containing protein [Haloferax sp. ATB1]
MATRRICEGGFDEDVSNHETSCPECDGQVRTNAVETICEGCGLVIDEQKIDYKPEWRSVEDDEETTDRTDALLTVIPTRNILVTIQLLSDICRVSNTDTNEVSRVLSGR